MSGSLKEFNKWYDNIEKEYPLYQDKDGYNIGNIRALRVGWKAALEWIKYAGVLSDCTLAGTLIDEELEE